MRCFFCNREIKKATGKMFVTRTGQVLYFCSSKCEKNALKLRRNPKKVRWVVKKKKQ